MCIRSKCLVVLAGLVLSLSHVEGARGDVELKLKLDVPNATQETHTVLKQTLSSGAIAVRREIVQDVTTDKIFNKAADGFELSTTIRSINVVLTLADGSRVIFPPPDAASDERDSNPNERLFASCAGLIGPAWTVKRDNGLRVTEVQLNEEFEKKIPTLLPIIRSRFTKEAIKQTEESEQGRLPGRIVKTNDTWNVDQCLLLDGDNKLRLGVKYTYIESSIEGGRDLHKVRFVVESVRYEPSPSSRVQSTGTFRLDPNQISGGEYFYDAAWGQVVKMSEHLLLEGDISVGGEKPWKVATGLKLDVTRTFSLKPLNPK